jgi:hypothetical protein
VCLLVFFFHSFLIFLPIKICSLPFFPFFTFFHRPLSFLFYLISLIQTLIIWKHKFMMRPYTLKTGCSSDSTVSIIRGFSQSLLVYVEITCNGQHSSSQC